MTARRVDASIGCLTQSLWGLAEVADAGRVAVATLNYDGLLHSGFMDEHQGEICDLATPLPDGHLNLDVVPGAIAGSRATMLW